MPDNTEPDEENVEGDKVGNEEILYRSVWLQKLCFKLDNEGNVRVSPEAFADRSQQPSVYRKHLCDAPPHSNPPRMGAEDAVVSLIAGSIRQESPIEHTRDKEAPIAYVIDVKPDRSNGQHQSHAVVFANPDFPKNSPAFKKLKIKLAMLAKEWAIAPDKEFVKQLSSL